MNYLDQKVCKKQVDMLQLARQLQKIKTLILQNNEQTTILLFLDRLIAKASKRKHQHGEVHHFSFQQMQDLKKNIKETIKQRDYYKNQWKMMRRANQNIRCDLQMAEIEIENLSKYKKQRQYEFADSKRKPCLKSTQIQCDIISSQTFEQITYVLKSQRQSDQHLDLQIQRWKTSSKDKGYYENEWESTDKDEFSENSMDFLLNMSFNFNQSQLINQLTEDEDYEQMSNKSISNESALIYADSIDNQQSSLNQMRINSDQFLSLQRKIQPTITSIKKNH